MFAHFSEWPDKFSIIDFYLSICNRHPVYGYVQSGLQLMDVGKMETIAEAEAFYNNVKKERE